MCKNTRYVSNDETEHANLNFLSFQSVRRIVRKSMLRIFLLENDQCKRNFVSFTDIIFVDFMAKDTLTDKLAIERLWFFSKKVFCAFDVFSKSVFVIYFFDFLTLANFYFTCLCIIQVDFVTMNVIHTNCFIFS